MSDQDQDKQPESQPGGFMDESGNTLPEQATPAGGKKGAGRTTRKSDQLKANFAAVFGHGIGKFALVAVVIVVVLLLAFAVRGLNSQPVANVESAQVDVPRPPAPKVSVDPIDQREAERRAEQAAKQAEAAAQRGQTYQPDFNPNVIANQNGQQPVGAQPRLNVGDGADQGRPGQPPVPPGTAVPITLPTNNGTQDANAQQQQQQQQQEAQRQQAQYDKQVSARDKYVDQVRGGIREQVEDLLGGKGKDGGLRGVGTYSNVSYMPKQQAAQASGPGMPAAPVNLNGVAGSAGAATSPNLAGVAGAAGAAGGSNGGKVIFKAGKAIFATLDSEVNTDDGGDVFATVRGGKYDGARLIGKIEQAPRNIRLRFNVLAPQDDRPTLSISAIAIREVDAKQGVAETIDHHTLERYSALLAGSILSGIGKAAQQPQGNTIVLPNGQVIVQQDELSNKRIAMYALGDVGQNAGAEVQKSFSQPPTYITPANKGIGVIFLSDVVEK